MRPAAALVLALCFVSVSGVTGQDEENTTLSEEDRTLFRPCPDQFGGGCPNTCTRNDSVCCYCEECTSNIYGTTQSCSCCPKGHTCCNNFLNRPVLGGRPLCCPAGTYCRSKGAHSVCVVEQIAPPTPGSVQCSNCGAFIKFTLTADNEITEFYYDGVLVPQSFLPNYNDWPRTDTISIPATASVLAVKLLNYVDSPAGFLASSDSGAILTNSQWRCTDVTPPSDWMTEAYDASGWNEAVEIVDNNGGPLYGLLPSISTTAQWIWFINAGDFSNPGWGTVAYCRLDLQ